MSASLHEVTPLLPAGEEVEASLRFYTERLGFEELFRHGAPVEVASVRRGGATLMLCRQPDRRLAEETSVRIRVEDVAALYEEYRAQGVIHPNGALSRKPWGTREFSVLDPAGVCLAFYEPAPG